MIKLNRVIQKENECVLASIAIATNIHYEEVRATYPEFNRIGVTTKETCVILDRLEVGYIRYIDTTLFHGRVYIVSVPSLNNLGSSHCIVVDSRMYDNENIFWKIYDPNEGFNDQKYYSSFEELKSWYDVIEIVL